MLRDDATRTEATGHEDASPTDEQWLRCVACGHAVARERARISVNGAHVHEFTNPAAIRFRVACFGAAEGSRPSGARETVWSWFPGHAWQIELCASCTSHLGWSFHAPSGASFWGIVEDRVH